MVDTRLQAGRGEDFSAARKRREIDELAELANLDDDDFRSWHDSSLGESFDTCWQGLPGPLWQNRCHHFPEASPMNIPSTSMRHHAPRPHAGFRWITG